MSDWLCPKYCTPTGDFSQCASSCLLQKLWSSGDFWSLWNQCTKGKIISTNFIYQDTIRSLMPRSCQDVLCSWEQKHCALWDYLTNDFFFTRKTPTCPAGYTNITELCFSLVPPSTIITIADLTKVLYSCGVIFSALSNILTSGGGQLTKSANISIPGPFSSCLWIHTNESPIFHRYVLLLSFRVSYAVFSLCNLYFSIRVTLRNGGGTSISERCYILRDPLFYARFHKTIWTITCHKS